MAERKGKGAGEKTDQSVSEKLGLSAIRSLFDTIKNYESDNKKVLKQMIQGQALSREDSIKIQTELRKTREGLDLLRKSMAGMNAGGSSPSSDFWSPSGGNPSTSGRDASSRFTGQERLGTQKAPVPQDPTAAAKYLIQGLHATPQKVVQLGPDGQPIPSEPPSLKKIASDMHEQMMAGDLSLEQAKAMAVSLSRIVETDGETSVAIADLLKVAKDPKSKDTGLLVMLLAAVRDTKKADETKVDLDDMDKELGGILKIEKRNTERQEKKDREKDTHLFGNRGLGILTGMGGGQGIKSLGDISGAINVGVALGQIAVKFMAPMQKWIEEHLGVQRIPVSQTQQVQTKVDTGKAEYASRHQGNLTKESEETVRKKIPEQLQIAQKLGTLGDLGGHPLGPDDLKAGTDAFMMALGDKKTPDEAMEAARAAIFNQRRISVGVLGSPAVLKSLQERDERSKKELPKKLAEAKEPHYFNPSLDIDKLRIKYEGPIAPGPQATPGLPSNGSPQFVGPPQSGIMSKAGPSQGFNDYIDASGVDLMHLNPAFGQAVYGMAKDYFEKTGKKLKINSAYRSPEEQQALVDQKKMVRRPDGTMVNIAASPARSPHVHGLGVDINDPIIDELSSLGLLKKYGLTHLTSGEKHHVEFIGGPSSGGPFAAGAAPQPAAVPHPSIGPVTSATSVADKIRQKNKTIEDKIIKKIDSAKTPKEVTKLAFDYVFPNGEGSLNLSGSGLEGIKKAAIKAMIESSKQSGLIQDIPKVSPTSPVMAPDSDISKKAADIKAQESRNRSTPTAQISPRGGSNNSLPAPGTPKTTGVDDLALAILKHGMLESV